MELKPSIPFLVFLVSVFSVLSFNEAKDAPQVGESKATESHSTKENDIIFGLGCSCNGLIVPKAPQDCELIQTKLKNTCHAYYHCKTNLNWHMADKFCKRNGLRLAVVDSLDVFNSLTAILKPSITTTAAVGFWIGGSDLGNEGNWYWATNGQLLIWAKWHPTEPNGVGYENCLDLYKHSIDDPLFSLELGLAFNDRPCSIAENFICQTK